MVPHERRFGGLLSMVLVASVGCASGPARRPVAESPEAVQGQLPPLLDRELFFGERPDDISSAALSPDGVMLAFLKPHDGVRNLWVKAVDAPLEEARPLTASPHRPIDRFFWSQDSRFVLFSQDRDGDENYNVFAVEAAAPAKPPAKVPEARALTDVKGARAVIYATPKAKPRVVYIGLNDRDPAWHDLYEVDIVTGKRKLLRKNDGRFTDFAFDRKGALRLATRVDPQGNQEVVRLGKGQPVRVFGCGVLESCDVVAFHPDGARVYVETNVGEGDLSRLVLVDVRTGKEELVESDPAGKVDFGHAVFSPATDALVGSAYNEERLRFHWRDGAYQQDFGELSGKLGDRDVELVSASRDDRRWLLLAYADVEPGEFYLFDRASKALTLQFRVQQGLPREHLAPTRPIRYASKDGLEIPAYLTVPKGLIEKHLPLVVLPHGGPWGRDWWEYSPMVQFLANRGYAVLRPNFRGSTGYGKRFVDAGNGQWAGLMQDDLTWGVKHLVDQGIVNKKRVAILGGSYGGYATLAGITFTPTMYSAAVAIVAPSNLVTLLESVPPYWEAMRAMFRVRVGDISTPEGRAALEAQSPLTHATKIVTPLLIVQGANDPRVKKAEADQIVRALRDRGYPVEYLLAEDEGHGFARPINNVATFARVERFLARHVGGRAQDSLPQEVQKRIEQLTVDLKAIEGGPDPVSPSAVGGSGQ